MPCVKLDTGALIALDRGDGRMIGLLLDGGGARVCKGRRQTRAKPRDYILVSSLKLEAHLHLERPVSSLPAKLSERCGAIDVQVDVFHKVPRSFTDWSRHAAAQEA